MSLPLVDDQNMDFLDLTDATELERKEIHEMLFSSKVFPGVEFPFELEFLTNRLKLGLSCNQTDRRNDDTDDGDEQTPVGDDEGIDDGQEEAEEMRDIMESASAPPLVASAAGYSQPFIHSHHNHLPEHVAVTSMASSAPFPSFDGNTPKRPTMMGENAFKVPIYPLPVITSISPMSSAVSAPTPAAVSSSLLGISPSVSGDNRELMNATIGESGVGRVTTRVPVTGGPATPYQMAHYPYPPPGPFMTGAGAPFPPTPHFFPQFFGFNGLPGYYVMSPQHMQPGVGPNPGPHPAQGYPLSDPHTLSMNPEAVLEPIEVSQPDAESEKVKCDPLGGGQPLACGGDTGEEEFIDVENGDIDIAEHEHERERVDDNVQQVIGVNIVGGRGQVTCDVDQNTKGQDFNVTTVERTITTKESPTARGIHSTLPISSETHLKNSAHQLATNARSPHAEVSQQSIHEPRKKGSPGISPRSRAQTQAPHQPSSQPQAAAQVQAPPPPSSGRSWASLFKGNSSSTDPSGGSSQFNAVLSLESSSSFPNIGAEEPQRHGPSFNSIASSSNNYSDKLVDAQITSIPLEDDSMARKIARKLKEIHLKHSLPLLVPRGFVNRGNWCYINATLQALLYCPPFYNLMREVGEVQGVMREKSSTPIIDSFAKFFANFYPLEPMMKKMKSGGSLSSEDLPKGDTFEPKCIYDVLGVIKSECLKGKQEDAEEFLSSVLNGLHDEMIALFKYMDGDKKVNGDAHHAPNGHLEVEKEGDESNYCNEDDASLWKEVGPRHKAMPTRSAKISETPVLNIFGGSTLSVRTAGNDKCANRQPFFTLQLDIQSEKVKSVEDALRYLTSVETIQGYTCPKTKQVIDASYQTYLEQLPPILILHLKLFVYDKDGGSRKLIKKVDYPVDLELPRECLRGGDKSKMAKSYKLLGVVYHDGNESVKGHYLTDIFCIGSNVWLRCDDTSVKPITVQQLLSPQLPRVPYLLFYRRCDTLRVNQIQAMRGGHSSVTH